MRLSLGARHAFDALGCMLRVNEPEVDAALLYFTGECLMTARGIFPMPCLAQHERLAQSLDAIPDLVQCFDDISVRWQTMHLFAMSTLTRNTVVVV